MHLRSFAPCVAGLAVSLALCAVGHAATTTYTGTFTGDDSVFNYNFSTTTSQSYTFATTSGAAGNFLPVLTLFNVGTGKPVDFTNDSGFATGMYDVSLTDTLAAGSYLLALTEYPNVAAGNVADGFLFAGDPTATGDYCGGALTGKSFVNAESCSSATPLGQNYSLAVTNSPAVAATPEPSSFLLMLAPAAGLFEVVRRRRSVA